MKHLKFLLLGLCIIFLIISVVFFVPIVSPKVAVEVGTRFAKNNIGVEVSVSIRSLSKYKIKECNIKVTYYDAAKNVVTSKNIKLENETSTQWYDELNTFTTPPVEIQAEIIDYQIDYGSDIALMVLCFIAFAGTLIASLVLFKKQRI